MKRKGFWKKELLIDYLNKEKRDVC